MKNEGSPRLQSLLGAAGMIGQDRLLDNETSGKKDEESTANTSADSLGSASDLDKQTGDDSPADKMMRFFTGKPCKERSKKSKAIKFPLKVRPCTVMSDKNTKMIKVNHGLRIIV